MFHLENISKSFGSNEVLRGVDLELRAGTVTALLGANGAGKSTVIKVLSGIHPDYGGTISLDGAAIKIDSTAVSRSLGIEPVHQKISDGIVPGLSVAENLLYEQIVSNQVARFASLRSLLPQAREIADVLNLNWDDSLLRSDVYELPIADQQLLLLSRALVRKPRLLILDEPTSALSESEAARLFGVMDRLRDEGVAILYVSHRLREIDLVADELVVLRDGQIRGNYVSPFNWPEALEHMLGHVRADEEEANEELRGDTDVVSLTGVKLMAKAPQVDVSFRGGEVTGVFGLLGSGKTELVRTIFGADRLLEGQMVLDGKKYAPRSPAAAISRGVYMVPEDRVADAIVDDWSIARTVTLPFVDAVSRLGIMNHSAEDDMGEAVIRDFGVVATSADDPVISLSGGNQQKVVVGRWLKEQPRVMLLDEPFQGVDIGARRDLVQRVREVAANGSCVVLTSSDLEEIMQVADRVLVLVDGDLRHDSFLSETSRQEILQSLVEAS